MSIPAYLEPPCTLSEILFHGTLDMSLHSICIHGKAQSHPYGHICLVAEAYHMLTHVKSLSWHNISDGSLRPEQWL